jgi:hypothetical protein
MAWTHQVDVVTTSLLQVEHHAGELEWFHGPADAFLADFPVLAKHAAKITPAEKNRPRSFTAPKDVFLSTMRPKTMNDRALPCSADSSLNRSQAIHVTVSCTQVAFFQMSKGLTRPLSQSSGVIELQVARLELRAEVPRRGLIRRDILLTLTTHL